MTTQTTTKEQMTDRYDIRMSDELLEAWNFAKRRIERIIQNQDMGFITYNEMREQISWELKNVEKL